ncbi:MoxR family ATPase [Halobacterium salinarum]|uniref:AAA family ATPase n=1 Tax=Halobacterium salinarum TaxID=2242 RepID=UPI0025573FC2|nr:MoxR family ATPase [Halobacterium salinarum]MDL0120021.1 MoxR family ATPase [Halobacterium salinarum]
MSEDDSEAAASIEEVTAAFDELYSEISTVLVGNEDVVEQFAVALLTGGHVLVEGVPGVAKTTAANAFARALGLEHRRVQMTPDLLPADITGTHVYRDATGEFELERGPIFANLVVADEINRATPKTQSALLEAMREGTVTIEGETQELPAPFMVVATQNPIEMEGTFALPEAQRDRFQFKVTIDIPERNVEREILDRFDADAALGPEDVNQALTSTEITALRARVMQVQVADEIKKYVLDIVHAVRESPQISMGGSPRATLAFLNAGKARAAIRGRDYVIPDDVKALVNPILRHRVILSTEAELKDRPVDEILRETVATVSVPSESSLPSGE